MATTDEKLRRAAQAMGRRGGQARAAKLTAEQRQAIATMGSRAAAAKRERDKAQVPVEAA